MRVTICGARGSTPAPGADFARYGGHTSCVALAHDGEVPSLLLDAGTGIRNVKGLLGDAPFSGAILMSHLHWDHTMGLPFFRAGDHPDATIDLYLPAQGDAEAVLTKMMSPPHFPITPAELRGTWRFLSLDPGQHDMAGFSVLALEVPHKGGRAYGYRITDGTGVITYIPDHRPTALGPGPDGLGERHGAALTLAADSDAVLHDSQYTDEELPGREDFGHSCPGYGVGLATEAGAKRLWLFHHDPPRTDAEIDAIAARYQGGAVAVSAAAEGLVIDLPGNDS